MYRLYLPVLYGSLPVPTQCEYVPPYLRISTYVRKYPRTVPTSGARGMGGKGVGGGGGGGWGEERGTRRT